MTATTTSPAAGLSLGHPVRSFVLALLAVGLALLAMQWTGVVYPNIVVAGSGGQELGDGLQTETVGFRNEASLPVDIVGLEWPTDAPASTVGIAPSTSGADGTTTSLSYLLEPFEPFTLEPGETAWVGIRVAAECTPEIGSPTIEVRTASGVRRHLELASSTGSFSDGCE
jgi:hypothetical protein